MSEDNLTNTTNIPGTVRDNPPNAAGPVNENPVNATGPVEPVPSAYSDEYLDYVERRYERAVDSAVSQNARGTITPEELSSVLNLAILERTEGLQEYIRATEEMDREEAALAEFDNDLKLQIEVQNRLNRHIRERARQVREEMREARLRQRLEAERQKTERLQEQLGTLESESGAMGLH